MTSQTGQAVAGVDQWHELAQQLRVDSIRSSGAAGSGHPTSSMSAADLMAVLMSKYLRYDFDDAGEPGERPLDLLQRPRFAALVLDLQGGRRHIRGRPDELPQLRQPLRGTPDAPDTVGGRCNRLAGPGPAPRRRLRTGEQVPGQTGLPHLGAVRRLRDGRRLHVGGFPARRALQAGQPHCRPGHEPPGTDPGDDGRLGRRTPMQKGPAPSGGRPSR